MVGTRTSQPNVDLQNLGLVQHASKEVRMLNVDGTNVMLGEAPKAHMGRTYNWRGAVYLIAHNTPREWINAHPQRQRRKGKHESDDLGPLKRKRKSTGELDGRPPAQDADAADEVIEVTDAEGRERAKKRVRKSMPNMNVRSERRKSTNTTKPATTPKLSSTTKATASTPQRNRRQSEGERAQSSQTQSHTRDETPPLQQRDGGDSIARPEPEDDLDPPLDFEKDMAGVKEAREMAIRAGYEQHMLAEEEVLPREAQEPKNGTVGYQVLLLVVELAKTNRRIDRLGKIYEKMRNSGAYSGIMKKRKAKRIIRQSVEGRLTPPSEEGEAQGDEETSAANFPVDNGVDELSADFMDQVQQYSRQGELEEQDRNILELLKRQLQNTTEEQDEEAAEDEEQELSQDQGTQGFEAAHAEDREPPPVAEQGQEPEPDTATDSSGSYKRWGYESTTTPGALDSPNAQASASSHTTPSVQAEGQEQEDEDETSYGNRQTKSPQVQIISSKKRASAPTIPAHDRGGKRLRWSLGAEGFHYSNNGSKPKVPLEERLRDPERAEHMIFRGRMQGESHQARRRRIKREMNILKSMPVVDEAEARR
ncbi:Hypothetical predicted protein [Lecanosticta acicola]|uniref:Uncharacterized protein n=1 Tax=Lecanosticta acicola TaxID=111012 RepID=A0AAI8Z8M9_9PEZI|nr:Hypothetical predicted protein [Lecanosticta acicola]